MFTRLMALGSDKCCGGKMNAKIIPLAQAKPKPRISVIMVSYHTGPALLEAVRSVLDDPDVYELILVDNGSTDVARQSISRIIINDERVKLLQGQDNIGFAKGCNYGVSFATGDLFLFLNPDAIISSGSARQLAVHGESLKSPWVVGGLLRDIQGREQRGSRRRELTPLTAFVSFTGLYKLPGLRSVHMDGEAMPKIPHNVPVVSGAFMMMDRASFNDMGGFDEGFFLHVEDIDICRRVRQLGGEVAFHPKASVMHYGSTSSVPRHKVEWEKLKGFVHYFSKHAKNPVEKLLALILVPFMTVAIMGRALYLNIRQVFRGR